MTVWSQARALAAQTPGARNRYVDFLRAGSILFVIYGHWLIATAHYEDGALRPGDILSLESWTGWLTWIFQVMPVFFIVGGYANAVSLDSARRRGIGYAGWLAARLRRLVSPLLVLLAGWAALALALRLAGAGRAVIQLASQAALIPIWFLAIYIVVVILAPATYRAWERWGFLSFWAFVVAAVAVDLAFFGAGLRWLGWTNYLWVWLAVHHLGYAWRGGRLGRSGRLLTIAAVGLAALLVLVLAGPYPLAMAGSPGSGVSNTLPPKVTLLALAACQLGLLLALEKPMRRALARLGLWTATVLVNSMIMTLYLWHVTVMVIVVAVAYLAGGIGLGAAPGSAAWWGSRPLWLALLTAALVPLALVLSPLERRSRAAEAPVPAAARQVVGAVLLCCGVATLALHGFGGGPGPWLAATAFAAVVVGAGIGGVGPWLR